MVAPLPPAFSGGGRSKGFTRQILRRRDYGFRITGARTKRRRRNLICPRAVRAKWLMTVFFSADGGVGGGRKADGGDLRSLVISPPQFAH